MIKCTECGREVSDRAPSCPHCGCPKPQAVQPQGPAQDTVLWRGNPLMFRGEPNKAFALLILVPLCVLLWAGAFDSALGEDAELGAKLLAVYAVLALPPYVLLWFLKCKSKTLTITSQRTILRRGLLSKNTVEVRHVDVRVVNVAQDILQRLFGTGRLSVGSAGHAGMEISITGIDKPDRAAAMIRERQGR